VTEPRIKAPYLSYPSPGGHIRRMRGDLLQPAGNGPFPTVLVIHETAGIDPYIEDVARRAATNARASWAAR
jgi:carboxymethylenebutenolidase